MAHESTFDFYADFDQHPGAFKQAQTFAEFCKLAGLEHLAGYKWAPAVFATAKAGKRTWNALRFPSANTFSDLFEDVKFLPTPEQNKPSLIPPGYKFLSGSASLSMHVGGTRAWSERTPNTRAHYGAKFYGIYVKPRAEVNAVAHTLTSHSASYEAIRREDGILVIGEDGLCIGSVWLALLPLSENIETLLDAETRALVERERQAERDAWETADTKN